MQSLCYAGLTQLIAKSNLITEYVNPISTLNIVDDNCCNMKKHNDTLNQLEPINLINLQHDDLKLASHKIDQFNDDLNSYNAKPLIVKHSSTFQIVIYTLSAFLIAYIIYKLFKYCKFSRLINSYFPNDDDSKCCVRIYNQCNNPRRSTTRIQPIMSFRNLNEIDNETEDVPLQDLSSNDNRFKYNYSN